MKEIWKTVIVPNDVNSLETARPMIDTMMEQLDMIQLFKRLFRNFSSTHANASSIDCNKLISGVCCRIVRGKSKEEFLCLSFPLEKRLTWLSGSESLNKFVSSNRCVLEEGDDKTSNMKIMIADSMGKPKSWVESKLSEGFSFKLYLMPQRICHLADWKGLVRCVEIAYPEVGNMFSRMLPLLELLTFAEIEVQIQPPGTFRAIKNIGATSEQYINLERLRNIENPQLWHLRGFLFNEIGANELYKGDGK